MSLGLFFWVLFLLWLVLVVIRSRAAWPDVADVVVLAALLFVLGWGVFGFIVKG